MARLETDRGWGAIYDPETDQDVTVGEDVDSDVAERIANQYGPVEAVDIESDDPDEFTCIGNGGECSRSVDEPGDVCWQH